MRVLRCVQDRGNDLQFATAVRAVPHVDLEHALEPPSSAAADDAAYSPPRARLALGGWRGLRGRLSLLRQLLRQLLRHGLGTSAAGLVAPFEYSALVLAAFWGFTIWGEVPAAVSGVGILLILSSGVLVALREARQRSGAEPKP
ncbi:MAG: DMT family transporter [Betaproteobacteria bacterium]|nr:DMT family transporter [Betaproteobacteria bacterium]